MENRKLFPPEIIDFSVESLFTAYNRSFRWIYLSVVLGVLIILALLPVVYVGISTQSRGTIRTSLENVPIQSLISGQVCKSYIEEGLEVKTGDTLLVLRTEKVDEQLLLQLKKRRMNDVFLYDLNLLLSQKEAPIVSYRYSCEKQQFLAKRKEFDVLLQMHKKEYDLTTFLYKERVASELEYLHKKNQYETVLSQKNSFIHQTLTNWEAEKSRIQQENDAVISSIGQLHEEKSLYTITAPVSGDLNQISGIQEGCFVNPGQVLAQISPRKDLLAEFYVMPNDIGYIHMNQPVKIQVDAFDYNQWGLLIGSVIQISEDIVAINNQPFFRVRCNLNQPYLQLKSGYKGRLKKGMTITGRFHLARRSLFQLLFDKVDNWLNPKLKGGEYVS